MGSVAGVELCMARIMVIANTVLAELKRSDIIYRRY